MGRSVRMTGGHCLITKKNVLLFGGGRERRTAGGRLGMRITTAVIAINITIMTAGRSGRVGKKFEV